MDSTSGVPVGPASTPPALGRISLILGEEHTSYNDLLARFAGLLTPSDIIEEAWLRDVVDLTWEVLRMRRLKASLLNACACEGMERALNSIHAGDAILSSRGWAARDAEKVAQCETALARAGFSMDTVMAQTLSERLLEIERIERMSMSAEARRNATLQHIERRRAAFAGKLRNAVSEAERIATAPSAARGPG